MENEENISLFYKKAYEDLLVPFVSAFLELSDYSLSLLNTLRYLEFSWSTLGECGYLVIWRKKEKEEQESARGH